MHSLISATADKNIEDLAYGSRDHETIIVSARTPVLYPWWIHLMAAAVFFANCAKIPHSINFARSCLPRFVSDGSIITPSDEQAVSAGAVILCLLSGIIGAVVMYILHTRHSRRYKTRDTAGKDTLPVSMWQLITMLALVFPDLWFAVVGESPYVSGLFLTLFTAAVIAITLRIGQPKNLLATLPVSLFLSFAL